MGTSPYAELLLLEQRLLLPERDIAAEWNALFTPEATHTLVHNQCTNILTNTHLATGLFRTTSIKKESPDLLRASPPRSWSTSLITATFYIDHRFTRRLETITAERPYNTFSRLELTPIVQITPTRSIRPGAMRDGAEEGEAEISPRDIDQTQILHILTPEQAGALEAAICEHLSDAEKRNPVLVQTFARLRVRLELCRNFLTEWERHTTT